MPDPTHRLADLMAQATDRGTPAKRIAAAVDVDVSTLWRWRTGQNAIPSDKIPTLARCFNVTPEHLMGWDREANGDHPPVAA